MLSVIVPYRDRAEHLALFKPAVYNYLKGNLDCHFEINIVEQFGTDPFNRAKLLNIGACLTSNAYTSYLCFHDVDHLPLNVDYSYNYKRDNGPIQLVKSSMQPIDYLGGVTLFPTGIFWDLNGFSNDFWGWGGEDNEMMHHLQREGVKVIKRFGVWDIIDHKKSGTFNMKKWEQSLNFRHKFDGVRNCRYELKDTKYQPEFNLRHFLVEI